MATTSVSDAVVVPQAKGTGLGSEDDQVDAAASSLLGEFTGDGEYVGGGMTFTGHDATNDQIDVTSGYCFIEDDSTSTSGDRGSGGNPQIQSTSSSGYDTEIPNNQFYLVIFPTNVTNIDVSDSQLNKVWINITDVTSNNSVEIRTDGGGGTTTAPSDTFLKIGEANPDDSSQDTRANDYPSLLSDEVDLDELGSDPSSPASGERRVYAKSDGVYGQASDGTVTGPFGSGGAPYREADYQIYIDSGDVVAVDQDDNEQYRNTNGSAEQTFNSIETDAANGDLIRISPGTYNTGARIDWTTEGADLIGSGMGSTVIDRNGGSHDMFLLRLQNSATNVPETRVGRFTIDGDSDTGTKHYCFGALQNHNAVVERLEVTRNGDGNNVQAQENTRCRFVNCNFAMTGSDQYNFTTYDNDDLFPSNGNNVNCVLDSCRFVMQDSTNTWNQVALYNSDTGWLVTNCIIGPSGHNTLALTPADNCTVTNNFIINDGNSNQDCVEIGGSDAHGTSGADATGNSVTNNIIYNTGGSGDGIILFDDGSGDSWVAAGTTIEGNTFRNLDDGIDANNAEDLDIGRNEYQAITTDYINVNSANVVDVSIDDPSIEDSDISRGATRLLHNGWGRNSGDPSSTGDWNGNGVEGVMVRDTTNNNNYAYVNGSWVQI